MKSAYSFIFSNHLCTGLTNELWYGQLKTEIVEQNSSNFHPCKVTGSCQFLFRDSVSLYCVHLEQQVTRLASVKCSASNSTGCSSVALFVYKSGRQSLVRRSSFSGAAARAARSWRAGSRGAAPASAQPAAPATPVLPRTIHRSQKYSNLWRLGIQFPVS